MDNRKKVKVHTHLEIVERKSTTQTQADFVINRLIREQNGVKMTKLHPHQVDATLMVTEMAKNSNVLLEAPTGSGKTGIIALLMYTMRAHQTMILTPTPTLSRQMKDAIGLPFKEISFWARAQFFGPEESMKIKDFLPIVQVVESTRQLETLIFSDVIIINAHKFGANSHCSIKKLHEGKPVRPWLKDHIAPFFASFDLLIVDEAHHFPAPLWVDIVTEYRKWREDGRIIFVTATPYRSDGNGKLRPILGPESGFQTYSIDKAALTVNVIRPIYFLERDDPDPFEDEKHEKLISDVFSALEFQQNEENRFKHQCLIIVKGMNFAKDLADAFNEKCPNDAVAIVGGHHAAKNEFKQFQNGEHRIAIVCRMLCEGFDLPSISVVVIYRIVKSQLLLEQYLGRCIRKFQFPLGNRELGVDRTEALVLSYKRFEQQEVFDNLNRAVAEDYVDVDVEKEGEE